MAEHPCGFSALQIRRQRIRDAVTTKAQWRSRVGALKKEEADLQPEVDKLQSEAC